MVQNPTPNGRMDNKLARRSGEAFPHKYRGKTDNKLAGLGFAFYEVLGRRMRRKSHTKFRNKIHKIMASYSC